MKPGKRTARTVLILAAGTALLILLFLSGPIFLSRVLSNAGMLALNPYSERIFPKDFPRAQSLLTEALRWDPANAAAYRGMASILWTQGQKEQAGSAWRRGGLIPRDFIRPAMIAGRQENYAEALAWFEKAMVTFPELSEPYVRAAITQEDLENWQAALDLHQKALDADAFPSEWWQWRSHHGRANMLQKLGRDAEAIEDYRWLTEHSSEDYRAFLKLGELLWAIDRDSAGAEAALRRSIEIDGTQKWGYSSLARVYYETDRLTEAADLYRKVLEIDPSDGTARKRLDQIAEKSR